MSMPPPNLGARFRKCDFQVHTLRDANWKGPFHPTKDRKAFADALVADCRRKRLDAIAITDHHDLCMWSVVREAAQSEVLVDGTPVPEEARLTVFPGVELTLSSPSCQVILLLDPNLPGTTLHHIWGVLA